MPPCSCRYCLVELGVSASKDDSDVSSSSFSSSLKLEEIPWDDSDKILIRKRRRSSLPPGERLDGVSMMRLSGYFTFVNYEKVLGKMKKLLRAGGAAEEEEVLLDSELPHSDLSTASCSCVVGCRGGPESPVAPGPDRGQEVRLAPHSGHGQVQEGRRRAQRSGGFFF